MPFLADPFTVLTGFAPGVTHRPATSAAPATATVRAVTNDAPYIRAERRIDAVDTNRPDYDAVPEHDPDGTPWAA